MPVLLKRDQETRRELVVVEYCRDLGIRCTWEVIPDMLGNVAETHSAVKS